MGRSYVVVEWDRHQQGELAHEVVEAETAEHAIAEVINDGPALEDELIYAAWPMDSPDDVVKLTFRPRSRLSSKVWEQ